MKNFIIAALSGLLIKDMPIWVVNDKKVIIVVFVTMLMFLIIEIIDYEITMRKERDRHIANLINRAINARSKGADTHADR